MEGDGQFDGTDVEVALGEGDFDMVFAEIAVDVLVELADGGESVVEVGQEAAEDEVDFGASLGSGFGVVFAGGGVMDRKGKHSIRVVRGSIGVIG